MNFKEILKKYKDHTATNEEIEYIEYEIEKANALNQYLNDQSEKEYQFTFPDYESTKELNMIKTEYKRRNVIIITIVVVIVICLLLLFNFAAVPILNSYYYNPTKNTYSQEFSNDFVISMSVYTELHFPGYFTMNADITKTGIGTYNIILAQYNRLDNKYNYLYSNLDKGKLSLPKESWVYPALNSFAYATHPFASFQMEENNKTKAYLEKMPEYIKLKALVSFKKDLSMEELKAFYIKYCVDKKEYNTQFQINWAGIRASENDKQLCPLIGFDPSGGGWICDEINQYYKDFEIDCDNPTAEVYQSHFMTLLQFQIDHPDFLKALNQTDIAYYQKILNYINKNGIKTYGIAITGSPKEILKLYEEENICKMDIEDLCLNKQYQ